MPKFKLTVPEPLEREIHIACHEALEKLLLPPAMYCCYPAGAAQLSVQQQAAYSRVGLKRGFPDLILWHQKTYGIEIKRVGGVLSKTRVVRTKRGGLRILKGQSEVFPQLLATGAWGGITIVHSVSEMLDQLRRWEIPLRAQVVAS